MIAIQADLRKNAGWPDLGGISATEERTAEGKGITLERACSKFFWRVEPESALKEVPRISENPTTQLEGSKYILLATYSERGTC